MGSTMEEMKLQEVLQAQETIDDTMMEELSGGYYNTDDDGRVYGDFFSEGDRFSLL